MHIKLLQACLTLCDTVDCSQSPPPDPRGMRQGGIRPARRVRARTSRGASRGRQGGCPARLPPRDGEAKSGQRPRRPHSPTLPARLPDSCPDLRPLPARDLGQGEREKLEAPACCSPAPALACRDSEGTWEEMLPVGSHKPDDQVLALKSKHNTPLHF